LRPLLAICGVEASLIWGIGTIGDCSSSGLTCDDVLPEFEPRIFPFLFAPSTNVNYENTAEFWCIRVSDSLLLCCRLILLLLLRTLKLLGSIASLSLFSSSRLNRFYFLRLF
jgi:hypothetical protein